MKTQKEIFIRSVVFANSQLRKKSLDLEHKLEVEYLIEESYLTNSKSVMNFDVETYYRFK